MAITVEMRTQVSQLYVALFGRAPDGEGLGYWVKELDSGKSIANVANAMYSTTPAQSLYPAYLTNAEIIDSFYTNVLGRPADTDPEGRAFWTSKLNDPDATPGSVIAEMIDTVANYNGSDYDGLTSADLFNNKVEVAQWYGETIGDLAGATTILANVTEDPTTIDAAKESTVPVQPPYVSHYALSTAADALQGGAGDDTFTARVAQNVNGEQTNQLATGDAIDGGAGTDTLNATVQAASALNNGPASAIAPETVDVEVANFTALAASQPVAGAPVVINAKFMNGLDKVGSIDSDVDLIVQNLNTLTDSGVYEDRRNTEEVTIRFDHGSNDATGGPADLVALFDNDYLLSDSSNTTTLELRMVNNLTLADESKPLDSVESVSFSVGTVLVETVITPEMQEMTGTTAYDALVDAIQAQLTTLGITGVTVVTLPQRTTVFSDDVGTHQQGDVAGLYSPILVTSTSGSLVKGQTTIANTTTDFNGLNTQTTESSTAENPIEVGVELLKVGRGGEGGELVIGGMATDLANNWDYTDNALAEGVQVFNVLMDGDRTQFSSLSGLYSTNNTLDTVNVTWAADSRADLIIGNQNTSNNRSVNSIAAPNNAGSTATDGFNSVTTDYNNALKDVRVFNAANNGVTPAADSAAAVSTDVTLNAHLSDEVVAKYMDRSDTGANPAADNANFAYTFGAGNDTLNLNISKDNLAASGTSGREDFTLAVNTGAGNDTVVTQIGDGKAAAGHPLVCQHDHSGQPLHHHRRRQRHRSRQWRWRLEDQRWRRQRRHLLRQLRPSSHCGQQWCCRIQRRVGVQHRQPGARWGAKPV